MPSLLGTEGAAAAVFYEAWSRFLPAEFPLGRRSTRPPKSTTPLLPLGPCLGNSSPPVSCAGSTPPWVVSINQDGRWSLPLDLMEPFRPALIEALTLRLFSHRILQRIHFETHDDGVWLTRDGRRTLIQHFSSACNESSCPNMQAAALLCGNSSRTPPSISKSRWHNPRPMLLFVSIELDLRTRLVGRPLACPSPPPSPRALMRCFELSPTISRATASARGRGLPGLTSRATPTTRSTG